MRERVLELVAGARASIEANRRRIDDLNVYPVPDGDTGTNLTLTVRSIDEALAKDGPDDRPGLAHALPHDCLTRWITTSTAATSSPVSRSTS